MTRRIDMAFNTDGMIGVNFTQLTTGTTTDGAGAPMLLGTRVSGTDGSEWVLVQAGAAITQYSWVAIDENYQAVMGTKSLADVGHQVGFAQVAFADNDFGWVAVHAPGNITVRLLASCAADVQLYTSGTAGALDDTSASQTLIRGVVTIAASTATTSSRECIAVHPSATATP
jgi:hypothetical protein